MIFRKCSCVLFSCVLFLGVFGCENTEYSAEWDTGHFDEISNGDSVHKVYDLVGEPLVVYAYPIPRKYAKAVNVELSKFPSNIADYNGLELNLHFSRQVDAHRDYKLYVVNLRQGHVTGKVATIVGD